VFTHTLAIVWAERHDPEGKRTGYCISFTTGPISPMLIEGACEFSPASLSRPDLFMPLVEYKARMDAVIDGYKNSSKAQGFNEILMPAELTERVKSTMHMGVRTYGKCLMPWGLPMFGEGGLFIPLEKEAICTPSP
jgi:hypothetical protein